MSIVAESYDDNSFCAVKVDISSTGSIKITIHIFDTTQTKTEADCQALHAIQSPRQQIATRSSTHQQRSQTTCFQQNAMSQRTSVFQAVSTTKGMHKCTASHHLISAHAATNSGNTNIQRNNELRYAHVLHVRHMCSNSPQSAVLHWTLDQRHQTSVQTSHS